MIPAIPDSTRVLVVGDVMLDRYWYGPTSRISPEAPVPVVHVSDTEERPGGAANVAVNIAAMGAKPLLLGIIGEDEAAETLQRLLRRRSVELQLIQRPDYTTVIKLRVMSRNQQLIRLDFENNVDADEGDLLYEHYDAGLAGAAAVVMSDYGKGALSSPQAFIARARGRGVPVLVDPSGDSFQKYRGADVITPNLAEFEAVAGRCADQDQLTERADALCRQYEIGALLVTRSEHGMTLLQAGLSPVHMPAAAREVYDVTGAGDTVVGVLAAGLAAGMTLPDAAAAANRAAGIVVGKLGTASVTFAELEHSINAGEHRSGIVDRDALLEMVGASRASGETVVMTNGCFDILHAGHVSCLTSARALGDRLVVAVNDDDSVRRLKGDGRPVNPLARRASVLAALQAVDWVVPFSQDTPQALIEALKPDVLVKGGDYRSEDVVGAEFVAASGGRVVIVELVEGCSTSELLADRGSAGQQRRLA